MRTIFSVLNFLLCQSPHIQYSIATCNTKTERQTYNIQHMHFYDYVFPIGRRINWKNRTERNLLPKKCRKMRKIEWLTDWTVSLVSLGIKASEHKSTRHLQQSANHRHFQLPGIKCFPFLFPFLLCHFTTILFAISPICSIRENKWCSTRRCEERPAEQRPAVVSLHFRFIRGYVVFARSRTQQTCHSPYKHMRRFTATLMNPGC